MSEQIWTAIISVAGTLGGAVAGYVASGRQSDKSFKQQMAIDEKKRQRSLIDAKHDYEKMRIERRYDQVEEFLGMDNENFQEIRHASIHILRSNDLTDIQRRIREYTSWRDNFTRQLYTGRALEKSIARKEFRDHMEQMDEAVKKMINLYEDVCLRKQSNPAQMLMDLVSKEVDPIYHQYMDALGGAFRELEAIRVSEVSRVLLDPSAGGSA